MSESDDPKLESVPSPPLKVTPTRLRLYAGAFVQVAGAALFTWLLLTKGFGFEKSRPNKVGWIVGILLIMAVVHILLGILFFAGPATIPGTSIPLWPFKTPKPPAGPQPRTQPSQPEA